MKIRLQRFMADCGIASRRACEALIAEGRVRVNGDVRVDVPVMIDPETDIITVDERVVAASGAGGSVTELARQDLVYFLLNKPKGILVTNNDPSDRKTVSELMAGVKERVFPVGRLDMDARGALIMTNDGELANRLTHPRHRVEKTYIVEVEGAISPGEMEKMKKGLWLGPAGTAGGRGHKTERFKVKLVGRERGRSILELKLSEGKNSDVRRVMARLGHPVRDLNRVAIGGKITIKGLDSGEYRALSPDEIKWLIYASSAEYHDRERAATQAWYEAKEMQKERTRLEREAAEAPPVAPRRAPVVRTPVAPAKPFTPRPPRKGKKPFVPPTGRNAGKALGGNFLGRRRLQRDLSSTNQETLPAPAVRHPLGDKVRRDED